MDDLPASGVLVRALLLCAKCGGGCNSRPVSGPQNTGGVRGRRSGGSGHQIQSGASGTYGPDTEAAVTAYKTERQILNFAGQIDAIVGKKTIAALDAEIERFDAAGGGAERGTRLRFAGLDQAVETSLGFDEVRVLVETALKEGELIQLPPDDTKRVLNPQQLVSVERI